MQTGILITRPQPEAKELQHELAAWGYNTFIDPVLNYENLSAAPERLNERLKAADVQMVIATSPRIIPQMADILKQYDVPLLVVGEKSHALARQAGIKNVKDPVMNAKILINTIRAHCKPEEGKLLYIRGEDISRDLQAELPGFAVEELVSYRMVPAATLHNNTLEAMHNNAIHSVVFYSERTAQTFIDLAKQGGVTQSLMNMHAVCLSPKIAEAARQCRWKSVHSASKPNSASLVEAIKKTLQPDIYSGRS